MHRGGEMGQGVAQIRRFLSSWSLTLADGCMGFVFLSTFLLSWKFFIIKFFLLACFLCNHHLDGLCFYMKKLITVSHTLGFPWSILTKSKPDVNLKENAQTVATAFPLGRWWGGGERLLLWGHDPLLPPDQKEPLPPAGSSPSAPWSETHALGPILSFCRKLHGYSKASICKIGFNWGSASSLGTFHPSFKLYNLCWSSWSLTIRV